MSAYNVQFDEEQMRLLVTQYLAENNLYQTLYVFKQESNSQTPIYNRYIDLVNQYFVEESYGDILRFLIQLPYSPEMFELLFKVTQLELLASQHDEEHNIYLQEELKYYFSLVPAIEVNRYGQRLESFDQESKRQFQTEVFEDLQRVLIPYYNQLAGSECVFTQLPGHRLKTILQNYYNMQFDKLEPKSRPRLKTVMVDLFKDQLTAAPAVEKYETQVSGQASEERQENLNYANTTGYSAVQSDFQKASYESEQTPTEYDTYTISVYRAKLPNTLRETQDKTRQQQEPESEQAILGQEEQETAKQFYPAQQAYQKLLRSQYFLLSYYYDRDSFTADILYFIKYEGLYRIIFSPNGAQTLKRYNLPFDADQVILTDSKLFAFAVSYQLRQIAVFDVNFHDAISIKDFADIFESTIVDCALFDTSLYFLFKDSVSIVDTSDFGLMSSLQLQLFKNESVQYFYMGKLPAIFTGCRALFVGLQHESLVLLSEYNCKYGDCAVISSSAMLCNSSGKMYVLDFYTRSKAELQYSYAKLIQMSEYGVFGITNKNKLFSYLYKTGEFVSSQNSVGSQEVVYFQVVGANVFWISQNGVFGNNRLSEFLL